MIRVVFDTDARQHHLAENLCGVIRDFDWKRGFDETEAAEVLESADCLVLPTPAARLEKYPGICRLLYARMQEGGRGSVRVYGGVLGERLREIMDAAGVSYVDLMKLPEVTAQNAQITAEATIAELLRYGSYSISGQKVIVAGYGYCGRAIADLLCRMGAKVTVLARSVEARKLAKSSGCNAVDFAYAPEEAYGARSVINTVPARVIREPMLREMHKDAVVLDIASRPGGVDLAAAERHQITVIAALGLPGIYTTRSSAKVLSDAIRKQEQSGMEAEKEGKSWIYRIAL